MQTLVKASSLKQDNLLINSDFSSGIINQQGLSQYTNSTSKSKLSVDMWIMNGLSAMTMTINDSSITFDTTSATEEFHSIFQRVERGFEEGQKLCLRAYVDDKYYDYAFEFNKTDSFVSETFDGKFRFNSNWNSTYNCLAVQFSVAKGKKVTLHKLKLEYGSMFTGMPVYDKTVELVKCQRYFEVIPEINLRLALSSMGSFSSGYTNTFLKALNGVFKVEKIRTPSVTYGSITNLGGTDLGSIISTIHATTSMIKAVTLSKSTGYYDIYLRDIVIDSNNY